MLYGDNVAAIASVNNETGSWRTRHLRLRACCLRDAVSRENPIWTIRWLAGSRLLADGGTKPRFLQFRAKLRVATGVDGSKVALRAISGVSPSFDFKKCQGILLGGVALLATGQWSLAVVLLVVAVGILKVVGTRPETKDAQGPKPRPQQERKKIEEGSANNVNPLGLDRSGTVTLRKCCPAQQVFGDEWQSAAAPSLRMMRANEQVLGDGDQLPVRPRRRAHESSAAARGRAAHGRPLVLGSTGEREEWASGSGEPTTTAEGVRGGGAAAAPIRRLTPMPPFQRSERTGAMMHQFPLLQQPVTDPPRDLRVLTRLPSLQDSPNAVAVWDLEHSKVPTWV